MNRPDLRGIIPATVLPMKEDFSIDEDSLANYMKWMSKFKIGGLAINVDTGEGPHLFPEERVKVLEVVSDIARAPIIAGLTSRFTAEAVQMALDAKKAGADGLLMFPIPAFAGQPLDPDLPYQYHKIVAEKANLPMVLFQLQPALGGIEFSPECLMKLIEIEQVVAIKEASFDAKKYADTLRTLRHASRKINMLTGNDNFIYESFILGAEGALIGFGTLATDLQVEMFELVQKKRLDEAREISSRLQPLIDAIFAPPVRDYRARTKEALVMQGVIKHAYVRPPLLPVSESDRSRIKNALKKAGLL